MKLFIYCFSLFFSTTFFSQSFKNALNQGKDKLGALTAPKSNLSWCYYENKTGKGSTYDKLYNWYAVNDPRGLAPKGYHIPTDKEWTILSENLGGESETGTK